MSDDLDLDDFTAVVVATGATDMVRQLHLAAVRALRRPGGRQPVMRTTHIPPGLGNFLSWNGHFSILSTRTGLRFAAYTQKGSAFASLLPNGYTTTGRVKFQLTPPACLQGLERREGIRGIIVFCPLNARGHFRFRPPRIGIKGYGQLLHNGFSQVDGPVAHLFRQIFVFERQLQIVFDGQRLQAVDLTKVLRQRLLERLQRDHAELLDRRLETAGQADQRAAALALQTQFGPQAFQSLEAKAQSDRAALRRIGFDRLQNLLLVTQGIDRDGTGLEGLEKAKHALEKRLSVLEDETITQMYNDAYDGKETAAEDRELAEEMLSISAIHEEKEKW